MKLSEQQIARVKFLENEQGQITPALVLADAQQETSVLHPLFDWDQAKAAHTAWLDHAREIIRTVKVVITTTTMTVAAPYYVRDPDVRGAGYRSTMTLQRDPVSARQALTDELTRTAGNLIRAKHLAIALGCSEDFDELLEQVLVVKQRINVLTQPGEDTAGTNLAV